MRHTLLLLLLIPLFARAGSYGDDPCAGKKMCATIYVAPWCPYCKQNEAHFQDLLKQNATAGENAVRVVVGAGRRPGDNDAYARKYGYGALADDAGDWKRKLGARAYPSFFVQDAEGKVVMRDAVAQRWVETQLGAK